MKQYITVLRFLRLPLVWTAMGDSLAGAAIAMAVTQPGLPTMPGDQWWPIAVAVAIASAALYLFGMGLNDVADLRDDRAAGRPRPLATGDLSPRMAAGTLAVLLGLALVAAAFLPWQAQWAALATLVCIVTYDLLAKRLSVTAVIFMSLCRVLNGFMGFSAIAGVRWLDYFRAADHHRHGHGQASITVPLAWLLGLALVTAMASGISQWEKRRPGREMLAGRRVDFWIINLLLGLSVVNAAAVAWVWQSAWGLAWLLIIPLVKLTAWGMRRAR